MTSRSKAGPAKGSVGVKSKSSTKAATAAETNEQVGLEAVADNEAFGSAPSELKRRELLQLVSEKTDLSNNKIKPVMEAILEVLGTAIAEGRELNLQPFGRLKINRQKDMGKARVTIAKIRQSKSGERDEGEAV